MPSCAVGLNQALALKISGAIDLTVNDPTVISISFDPYSSINIIPGELKDLTGSNTTISEYTNMYSIVNVALLPPTFQTYNPAGTGPLIAELIFYFQGSNPTIHGYYIVVPIYYLINTYLSSNIAKLFPSSTTNQYIEYPYCNNRTNYKVIYLYNGINGDLRTLAKYKIPGSGSSSGSDSEQSVISNNRYIGHTPRFYSNISTSSILSTSNLYSSHNGINSTNGFNVTNQFKCVNLDPAKDVSGNIVLVDPKNGITMDKVLNEATIAQQKALEADGMSFIEKTVVSIIIIFAGIFAALIIYYILRRLLGDRLDFYTDGIKKIVDKTPGT
jgi:hypothetical protein